MNLQAHNDAEWARLDEPTRTQLLDATRAIVAEMPTGDVQRMKNESAVRPAAWAVEHHFWGGMMFRNALRQGGIVDASLPSGNLDDYYVKALELVLAETPA